MMVGTTETKIYSVATSLASAGHRLGDCEWSTTAATQRDDVDAVDGATAE